MPMQTIQSESSHSFVVKIWAEELDPTTEKSFWRGHITHVLSGERCYFQSIQKMNNFILPYLSEWDQLVEERL